MGFLENFTWFQLAFIIDERWIFVWIKRERKCEKDFNLSTPISHGPVRCILTPDMHTQQKQHTQTPLY